MSDLFYTPYPFLYSRTDLSDGSSRASRAKSRLFLVACPESVECSFSFVICLSFSESNVVINGSPFD